MADMLETPQGRHIAYHKSEPTDKTLPGVVFMGGFMSDMTGTKATRLEELCQQRGQGYVRFDYSGHGQSEGDFTDGSVCSWADDAIAVMDQLTEGPQILVGSSMGGWIAMLTARARPERVAGIVGIAAAPDFTEEMRYDLDTRQLSDLQNNGLTHIPSDYGSPYPISNTLIEDSKGQCLLTKPINIHCPVRLIQGTEDKAVPASKPVRIKAVLESTDVEITMIDGGDHSLSRPEDIEVIDRNITLLSSNPKFH
jgi:pimeloyl-ACP methyl ester carboxylesterase